MLEQFWRSHGSEQQPTTPRCDAVEFHHAQLHFSLIKSLLINV
jgi:hypothetical protein